MRIENLHTREISAPEQTVGSILDTRAGPDDRPRGARTSRPRRIPELTRDFGLEDVCVR